MCQITAQVELQMFVLLYHTPQLTFQFCLFLTGAVSNMWASYKNVSKTLDLILCHQKRIQGIVCVQTVEQHLSSRVRIYNTLLQ